MDTALASAPARKMSRETMRTAVLVAPRRFELREVPVPVPGPNEVQVRVQGCGICASNLPVFEGKPWFTYPLEAGAPGHEGWGIIERVGKEVHDFAPGDRIGMLSLHAFAEFDLVDVKSIVRLPAGNQPFPAEPLGCALNILKRALDVAHASGLQNSGDRKPRACATVAVIGIGFLGALLTQLLTAAGARAIAISRRRFALDLARQFGAAETIEKSADVIASVNQITGGKLCDIVIECVGKQPALDLAAELTCERGRLVVAGYHQDSPRQVNMQLWNWRGLDVINAHERDPAVYRAGMESAVEAVETGVLDPRPLYTHRFGFDQIGDAFETATSRPANFIKALVLMS
jgi:threonine dehydrogenase-like Zn-dependent dehydrogenase